MNRHCTLLTIQLDNIVVVSNQSCVQYEYIYTCESYCIPSAAYTDSVSKVVIQSR